MDEVLAVYGEEHAPYTAAPERIGHAIDALLTFWSGKPVAAIKGSTCRLYGKSRKKKQGGQMVPVKPGTLRRELNVLQAALNHCEREGHLLSVPRVTLPAKEETGQRAMTRSEVAALLLACRRLTMTRKDLDYRYVTHFIIASIYSGTRKSAALNLRLSGPATTGGWLDLDAGLLFRKGTEEVATNKRRSPAKLPRQMLAHARRWARLGDTWVVQYKGGRVADLKTAWKRVVAEADLGWNPTPHTLKHTAITWAIQGGASLADAAGYFSTSIETIERVYWHLSPHFQEGAVAAIEGRRA